MLSRFPRFVPLFTARLKSVLFSSVLSLAIAPLSRAITTLNFESAANQTGWTFSTGPEYPGARGSLSFPSASGNTCGEMDLDFTPFSPLPANFNPCYVMATRTLSSAEAANVTRLQMRLMGSTSAIIPRIRILDSSGQTLQYSLTLSLPMTSLSSTGWLWESANLSTSASHWGGANDGVMHAPMKAISLIAEANGYRSTGSLQFDDLSLLGSGGTLTVNLADGVLNTPFAKTAFADHTGVVLHVIGDTVALNTIASTGFRWVRTDLTWSSIEKVAGVYDFSAFDAFVSSAETKNLRVIAILAYGNPLYTGTSTTPPLTTAGINAFGNFCRAAAAHYASHNVTFEIWNEPNTTSYWGGAPNATQYAPVLQKGIQSVKSGNVNATALTGGLSQPTTTAYAFWDTLMSLDAMDGADGWGTHLYTPGTPEVRWPDVLNLNYRTSVSLPGKQVWCTEWGYSSQALSPTANGHEPVGRAVQAIMDVRELLVGWVANLPAVVLYDIRDDGDNASDLEQNFGLLARDYSVKPVLNAVKNLFTLTSGRTLAGLITLPTLPQNVHILRMDGPSHIYAIWSEEGGPAWTFVTLPATPLRAVDIYGHAVSLSQYSSTPTVAVGAGQGVTYVEVPN